MTTKRVGVHVSHCCRYHGCKYGDDDCPVVAKTYEQEGPCEHCLDAEAHLRSAVYDLVHAARGIGSTYPVTSMERRRSVFVGKLLAQLQQEIEQVREHLPTTSPWSEDDDNAVLENE